MIDSAASECQYVWTKRANCFPIEARVSQSDPTQAVTLPNQTLHCMGFGQTSELARTRWLCSGAGQVVRPSSQVQAGADSQVQAARCKQVQTAEECFTRSGRIVGGQSPPSLPRSAASAGNFPEWLWALLAQTRWSDRPRPSLPQIPAPGWHSMAGQQR